MYDKLVEIVFDYYKRNVIEILFIKYCQDPIKDDPINYLGVGCWNDRLVLVLILNFISQNHHDD